MSFPVATGLTWLKVIPDRHLTSYKSVKGTKFKAPVGLIDVPIKVPPAAEESVITVVTPDTGRLKVSA